MRTSIVLVAVASLVVLAGCKKQATEEAPATATVTPSETPKPPEPAKPPEPPKPAEPTIHAGSHILLAYKGAMRAAPDVTRTKDEALALAKKLTAQIQKDPAKLGELAKKYSACPSKMKGGSLGSWPKGRMVPAFDEAIEKLKVGEVTTEPVETPFGYHVIMRNAPPPMFAGSHILIAYKGAMRAAPDVTRSKAEAAKLAKELAAKVAKDPSTLGELAKEHSACPSRMKGGSLGRWPKGQMVPAFDEALEKMKVGEVTAKPVETPFGFHVIRRDDPDKAGH